MSNHSNRRRFLQTTAAGGALFGLGDLGFLSRLPRVSAEEAKPDPNFAKLRPEIEPLVRLLETTPRDRLLEEVASKIHSGTSYREVLAALLLAAVRNVQPRPSVGFKFHAVLVVNSAHLASVSSPETDRWLPIFWALDYYKGRQLEEEQKSGWKLPPVDEAALPPAHNARDAFIRAMEKWDEAAADAAVASLARTAGANEVFELFYRFGGRDFRSIGHKAIFVANAQRTLSCIGWEHAEPVLRSLTFALLNREGSQNPAESDLEEDRPGRRNVELSQKVRGEWQEGKLDSAATTEMLAVLRSGSNADASNLALEQLNRGVSPDSVWDAVFVGAGELLARQPGIVGLHGLTTANAMHYAYTASGDDATRRWLLLQNCAFQTMFREAAGGRGKISDLSLDDLAPVPLSSDDLEGAALQEIFANINRDDRAAAGQVRTWLSKHGDAKPFIDAARRLVFLKGTDSHDYKFSSAVLEDFYHVSPEWRDKFLATSIYNLRSSNDRDNKLVERTRAALA